MKRTQHTITSAKVLTDAEEAHLRGFFRRGIRTMEDMRNALLFQILIDLGPRVSEVLNSKIKDFNPFNGTLFVRALKGSRDREMPMPMGLAREIRKYVLAFYGVTGWHQLNPEASLFSLSYSRAYQIWQFYTPNPDKTIHSLRHTFAVNLYRKTKDIKLVQLALGHKNILNTQVYVDFVYSQSTMRELMWG